jgi:arylformamidase
VVQFPDSLDLVTASDLEAAQVPAGTERLLLRTRNSNYWRDQELDFQVGFVGISPDAAQWLVSHGIHLVGIDYLSIAPYKQSETTHQILLNAGMIPLEGVDLHAVPPGMYDLYCLPLKLLGSDGAPARTILIRK